jgi:hypothetical protein
MKRKVGTIKAGVVLAVVFAAAIFFAPPVQVGFAVERLPDLTITNVYLTQDCFVAVDVKNLGPGYVNDKVWTVHEPKSPGVYLYRNGAGWGGASIWKFDPAKALQKPGGIATYVSTLKVTTGVGIKAVVDLHDILVEANESNNSMVAKLICQPTQTPQTGACCITGKYDGVATDIASATCLKPGTWKFVLVIEQTNCGQPVTGEIWGYDAAGALKKSHTFTGTVVSVPSPVVTANIKCCELTGTATGIAGTPWAAEVIKMKGRLCKNAAGKWQCANGAFTHSSGCTGAFTLLQR